MTIGGYVYLVKAVGTNRCKIGRARDVNKRFIDLKTQSPFPLKLIASFYVDDTVDQEKRLHKVASAFRVHGEWFELPDAWINCLNEWFYNTTCLKYQNRQSTQVVQLIKSLGDDYHLTTEAKPIPARLKPLPVTFAFGKQTQQEIKYAMTLLALISKGQNLKKATRKRLSQIMGGYPSSPDQARAWKASLKKLNNDFEFSNLG